MRFLFVGDTHGDKHIKKVQDTLPDLRLSHQDCVVHCGDIGVAWQGAEDEALRFWRSLPQKVLVCLGNHENYDWVRRQPLITKYGCRGYDLGGRVFAPLAGETARLGGRTLWFYPGGFSVDFFFRSPGTSLWKEELLETAAAKKALHRALRQKRVDFVVTHDGPRDFVFERFGFDLKPPPAFYFQHLGEAPDSRQHPAFLLDTLYRMPEKYGLWLFGHHHQDLAGDKIRCLWNQALLYDTKSGESQLVPLAVPPVG